jgi:hypothetical protein
MDSCRIATKASPSGLNQEKQWDALLRSSAARVSNPVIRPALRSRLPNLAERRPLFSGGQAFVREFVQEFGQPTGLDDSVDSQGDRWDQHREKENTAVEQRRVRPGE